MIRAQSIKQAASSFFLAAFEAKDYISIDNSFRQCYIHISMKRYASYRSFHCPMTVEDSYS